MTAAIVPLFAPAASRAREDLLTLHLRRGWHVTYREGEPRPCPGCGKSNFYVGRFSAECAFCGAAVPLEGAR